MKDSIIELIRQSAFDKVAFETLESIFKLYEQLQYSSDLNQLAGDIFVWLDEELAIKNMVFSLFDINKKMDSSFHLNILRNSKNRFL
mgnify:CR=1 FL=1